MNEFEELKELNVLYVDDDKEACDSLKLILSYYFKKVFIAHDGVEALNIYKKELCHLLIVDYDMPIMNGYEFLKIIREEDDKIAAFIISSYDEKIKLKNAIKLNLLDYLVKPYELSQLKEILRLFTQYIKKNSLLKYLINQDCYYDISSKKIIFKNEELSLTSYEIKIFEYLLKNKSKIVSYEELLYSINSTNHKSLVSIIHKINKKFDSKVIENIKDIGYKLNK